MLTKQPDACTDRPDRTTSCSFIRLPFDARTVIPSVVVADAIGGFPAEGRLITESAAQVMTAPPLGPKVCPVT